MITKRRLYKKRKIDQTLTRSGKGTQGVAVRSLSPALQREPQEAFSNSHLQTIQRQALATQIGQVQGNTYLQRLVAYNDVEVDGRFTDPEQASGRLPFNEDGTWDGQAIARSLTQLNPEAERDDNVRCVQTSFLIALVLRGPDALHQMIENYLRRYRVGLRQLTTPDRIKRWYRRAIRNLRPLLAKINSQTLTYEDLSTILGEMYDVYGSPEGGTFLQPELNMAEREGYQSAELNMEDVTQEQAAAQARALADGEILLCQVDVNTPEGTGTGNHRIHIGRDPQTSKLYLYDPWPVTGDQMVECDENLTQIEHYFLNPLEDEASGEAEEEEGGIEIEIFEMRTFHIEAKLTPPAEDMEEGE